MGRYLFMLSLFWFIAQGCAPRLGFQWYQPAPTELIEKRPEWKVMSRSNQTDPDTVTKFFLMHLPPYQIRVNIHVMQDGEGRHNFNENTGRQIIKQIIADANLALSNNQKMWLPKNNKTEVWPVGYQYVLTGSGGEDDGIYFHQDKDSLFYLINRGQSSNLNDERVFEKYGINTDSVLNIFVMANHPDSARSSTYLRTDNGIAFNSWVKVVNWWENISDTLWQGDKYTLPKGTWYCKNLLNHEIGHVLGLRHAWTYSDGCEDTPTHSNCWNYTTSGPCQDLVSNNVMDYNTYQNAWSPCQIERIWRQLINSESRVRRLLRPHWTTLDSTFTLILSDSMSWNKDVDLPGHLILEQGAVLTIRGTLNLPKDGEIVLRPGAVLNLEGLITYGGSEGTWRGIKLIGKRKNQGKIIVLPGGGFAGLNLNCQKDINQKQ